MEAIDLTKVPNMALPGGGLMPAIGMGTFGSDKYTPQQVSEAVAGALRAGYRLFDCASVYGNEHLIGQVFEDAFNEGVVKREELFIVTKVWNDMHGKGDVLVSCANSLKDLRLDYVDAFFVHWPFPNYHAPGCAFDARNPDSKPFSIEGFMSVWKQCERLVDMGLTKYIGMSNMTIPKLKAVLPLCRIKPAMLEMELHPSFQQPALFDFCISHDIVPVAFCPLGSPSRPERDKTPDDIVDLEMPEIVEIGKAHGIHPALVCLKWAVQRGQAAIPFSVNENKYVNNLKCVTEDPLTDEEMEIIKNADKDCRLVKGQVFLWPGASGWEDLWDMDGTITK